ncbi:peroxisomal adenine nucleotide carrier [Chloropicon primus]|nr:peroxisomal adenine nucleotide carrier [Chloropicon primus]UPR01384.1 peroxisomal adenine nucleotide carrier [Chloropicon primus]|eukprot:QDZ22166.1 peroxisomal adenine nucleotide carrier [Chloropicon primus]
MPWLSTLSEASAGALGQLCSTMLLYPLDTSKTRVQASLDQGKAEEEDTKAQGNENWKEWFVSLYTGIETKAVQTIVSQFLFFYTYEYIKKRVKATGRRIQAFDNVLIGMLAGSVNVLVTQPLDTYVTMKQSDVLVRRGKGDDDEEKKKKKKKDVGLYAALGPSLFLSINPGLQYAIFDQVKSFLLRKEKRKNAALSAQQAFFLGAFSKCVATVVTYPAIRGKVLCQSVHGAKYKGLAHAMQKIVELDGPKGLYKGLPQQLTKTVLSAAIGLMLKEKISQAERTFAVLLLKTFSSKSGKGN